jgi:excisionase family DNA binding protein
MPEVVLLTTAEVAKRFKVDSSAVRRWVAKGQLIPAVTTPGGYYRFNELDIQAFERAS